MKKRINGFFACFLIISLLFFGLVQKTWANTNIEVVGNGSYSDNLSAVESSQETTVVQENSTSITNIINSSVITGGNVASGNTNGGVTIETGAATANINVSNEVNSNIAVLSQCPSCGEKDVNMKISDNGSESINTASAVLNESVQVFQENNANIANQVLTSVISGNNEASENTGGAVNIKSSPATANVNIQNGANTNLAEFKSTGGGATNIEIRNNGAFSDNLVSAVRSRKAVLVQNNFASLDNRVSSDVVSGGNNASYNTGLGVTIDAGAAASNVNINNEANYNFAEVECCFQEVNSRISGNGGSSVNTILGNLDDFSSFFEGDNLESGNVFQAFNSVFSSPISGENLVYNETDSETPSWTTLRTGFNISNISVNNDSGVNVVSPSGVGDWYFDFEFDPLEIVRFLRF